MKSPIASFTQANRQRLTPIATAIAIALATTNPTSAATITVGGGCEITDAVVSANEDTATGGCAAGSGPDILVLAGNSYTLNTALYETDIGDGMGTLEPNSAFPAITSNITIQGNGSTISRGAVMDKFRLFYVQNLTGTLALESLTLTNGYADGVSGKSRAGGAVYSRGVLSLDHVTISSNTADRRGGGVHSIRSLSITNSMITGNVGEEGGGVGVGGAGSLHLSNTTISGNTAGAGGGLQSYASDGNIIDNVTITNNTTTGTGGGVSLFNTDTIITDSTISSNVEGSARGSGMQVFEGGTSPLNTLSISGTTMNLNSGGYGLYSQVATTINNSEFNQNVGGGLKLSEAQVIDQISADNNTGSGIHLRGTSATLSNCTANGNSSRGGIFYGSSITLTSVSSCSFNSNGGGGAIMFHGSLTDVTIANNTGKSGLRTGFATVDNVTVTHNSSSYKGGGINTSSQVTITNSTITNNSTSELGGGLYVYSGPSLSTQLTNTNVAYNVGSNGGGIYARRSNLTIQNLDIISNQATGSRGGGIRLRDGTTHITKSTIHDNQVTGYGGGLYNGEGGVLYLESSAISGNSAGQSGGGFKAGYGTATISNSTIFDNQATYYGGGISARSGSTNTTVRNATITNNTASNGGGIETVGFNQSMLNLYSTIVANNTGGECYNTPVDSGNNWFGDVSCNGVAQGDPALDIAAINASNEVFFSPLPGSGVIDTGGQCELATDQNDTARSICKCDIGAIEILELNPDNSSCKGTFFVIPTTNNGVVIFEL